MCHWLTLTLPRLYYTYRLQVDFNVYAVQVTLLSSTGTYNLHRAAMYFPFSFSFWVDLFYPSTGPRLIWTKSIYEFMDFTAHSHIRRKHLHTYGVCASIETAFACIRSRSTHPHKHVRTGAHTQTPRGIHPWTAKYVWKQKIKYLLHFGYKP